jgi:activator of HSP90 ATPase
MPRNVILAASFPTTADQLFDMYLDPREHSAFTGSKVIIESLPGATFFAFDGVLLGIENSPRDHQLQRLELAFFGAASRVF